MIKLYVCLFTLATLATSAFAGVSVTSPSTNATVQSPVHFAASASSSCSKGISAIGVYTAPYVLSYVINGSSLNTNLNLNPGTYNTVIQAWDNCGGAVKTPITITVAGSTQTGVFVTKPASGSTASSPVNFVASATTACPKGVAAMGIYTAPSKLAYTTPGASLNTNLSLGAGTYNTVVQEWDNCGGAATKAVTLTVGSSSGGGGTSGGTTFSNLQSGAGWTGYGLLPPSYAICSSCQPGGPQISWSMTKGITSPSLSGKASQMSIGGTKPFSDALWNNHLLGDFSSQGKPDYSHTLVPSLTSFTYDVYFYGSNLGLSQALEFDINQFFNNMGFIWGHECRIAGGHQWDTWDNVNQHWVPTGVPCNPVNNAWNHLIIQVQRTSTNQLVFNSITLNGVTSTLNIVRPHGSAPNWYGVTVNYQQDGNVNQNGYTVYLDKLNFTYK